MKQRVENDTRSSAPLKKKKNKRKEKGKKEPESRIRKFVRTKK